MAVTQFRVVNHRLGFWKSLAGRAFDVFAGGEDDAYASITTSRDATGQSWVLSVHALEPLGRREDFRETALVQGPFSLTTPRPYGLVSVNGPSGMLCARMAHDRASLDGFDLRTLGVACPVVVSVAHDADVEMLLAQPRRRLAELHHAWRDSETREGIVGTFSVAPDLDADLLRIAVLCAAVKTVWQAIVA